MRWAAVAALVVAFGVLATGAVGAVGHSDLAGESPDAAADANTDSYVFEQGEVCEPIEPLESGETVEEFYDYRDHQTHPEGVERSYSSYGTTHLQADDTSVLFLHDGSDGLSLVMVHGRLDGDGDDTYATLDVVGLPADAEWVVRNDAYDSEENLDEFHRGDGWANASWIQRGDRTGGGAIQGGLDARFAVTVHPAFNDEAAITPENHDHPDPDFYSEGEVEAWDVLSGSADEPDRTTLPSLSNPVTIRTGTCEDPSRTYDRTDDGITVDVTGADPDDRIDVQPTAGTADGIQFERVELSGVDGDGSFEFESALPEGLPSSPDGTDSLSSLVTDGDAQEVPATVTFSVTQEFLDEHGLDPESIGLYEADDEGWSQAETTVSDESDTGYRFTAEVSSLEALVVAGETGSAADESGPFGELSLSVPAVGVTVGVLVVTGALWMLLARR
jgi:hypothetical protein